MTSAEEHPSRELLRDYERRAEAAYAAMYDAQPHDYKDLRDDALMYLARAIEAAESLGLSEEVARLRARRDNIDGVYNSQFRNVRR